MSGESRPIRRSSTSKFSALTNSIVIKDVRQLRRCQRRGRSFYATSQDEPFILLKDGHCFRESAVAACRRARLRPNVVFESGQFATILAMVSAGMDVSVVPEMAVEPRAGCRFLRLADDRSYRRIGLVHLKNQSDTLTPRLGAVLEVRCRLSEFVT